MYNQELKEKFIEEFSTNISRKKLARNLFIALEPYETAWGADMCTVDRERLRPAIGELIGFREGSQKTRLSILKLYVKWCIQNNVDGARDELSQIEDFGIEKLKRQMVANPQHLQRFLDCILEPESEQTVDDTYRCYFWLAYSGMREEDVLDVRASDVDFQSMVIRYHGMEYTIYRESLPALRNCVELSSFQLKHPNYAIYKSRVAGDTIMRGFSMQKNIDKTRVEMSKKRKAMRFMPRSEAKKNNLDLYLSYYRVKLSGIFYRTYEAERAGMKPDFIPVAKQFMEGKTYKLDSGRNLIGAKQRRIAMEYLMDYNRWKEAYSTV